MKKTNINANMNSNIMPLKNNQASGLEKELKNKWKKREPWLVTDSTFNREWLIETPLRYFLHLDKNTGEWSVCDRWLDLEFSPKIRSKNKSVVVRRFYKLIGRPIPAR